MESASLLLLILGCTPAPVSLEDCAALPDTTAREDCRLSFIAPLSGDDQALSAALESIDDPQSRDLLRYRLAVSDPVQHSRQCEAVQAAALQEKCRQVVGRPHLSSTRKRP